MNHIILSVHQVLTKMNVQPYLIACVYCCFCLSEPLESMSLKKKLSSQHVMMKRNSRNLVMNPASSTLMRTAGAPCRVKPVQVPISTTLKQLCILKQVRVWSLRKVERSIGRSIGDPSAHQEPLVRSALHPFWEVELGFGAFESKRGLVVGDGRALRRVEGAQPNSGGFLRVSDLCCPFSPWPLPHSSVVSSPHTPFIEMNKKFMIPCTILHSTEIELLI